MAVKGIQHKDSMMSEKASVASNRFMAERMAGLWYTMMQTTALPRSPTTIISIMITAKHTRRGAGGMVAPKSDALLPCGSRYSKVSMDVLLQDITGKTCSWDRNAWKGAP